MSVVVEFECTLSNYGGEDIITYITILFDNKSSVFDFCDHPGKFEKLEEEIEDYFILNEGQGYGPVTLDHVLDRSCIFKIYDRKDDFDIDGTK